MPDGEVFLACQLEDERRDDRGKQGREEALNQAADDDQRDAIDLPAIGECRHDHKGIPEHDMPGQKDVLPFGDPG